MVFLNKKKSSKYDILKIIILWELNSCIYRLIIIEPFGGLMNGE